MLGRALCRRPTRTLQLDSQTKQNIKFEKNPIYQFFLSDGTSLLKILGNIIALEIIYHGKNVYGNWLRTPEEPTYQSKSQFYRCTLQQRLRGGISSFLNSGENDPRKVRKTPCNTMKSWLFLRFQLSVERQNLLIFGNHVPLTFSKPLPANVSCHRLTFTRYIVNLKTTFFSRLSNRFSPG